MIKCDKCGEKNKMGAIFCKSCGQRLNLENAGEQIQQSRRRERRSPKRLLQILRKLIGLALLVVAILVLVGIFLGVPMEFDNPLPREALEMAQRKIDRMTASESRTDSDPTVKVSEAEATAMFNEICGLRKADSEEEVAEEDPGFALLPDRVSVEFLDSGYVRVVLKSVSFKGIAIYSTLICHFESDKTRTEFVIHSGKVGKVPMPGPLLDIVKKRFTVLLDNPASLKRLLNVIGYIEMSDGFALVHLRRSQN